MPIIWQAEKIARTNIRYLNCWLGIATRESIGSVFCADCKYLTHCKSLYKMFAGSRNMHPAFLSRKIMSMFGIESEYLSDEILEDEQG